MAFLRRASSKFAARLDLRVLRKARVGKRVRVGEGGGGGGGNAKLRTAAPTYYVPAGFARSITENKSRTVPAGWPWKKRKNK